MDKLDVTAKTDVDLDKPIEEHIEMESATGRFRRDAIEAAQSRAAAEALANNRRDMRIQTDSFIAKYFPGEEPKKFSLFSQEKKSIVTDASISGLGIESVKGLNKGDKITLIISDGKKGVIPEFEIIATVMYAGAVEKKKVRYGLQYDQSPTTAYTEFINSETLKQKMEKNSQKKEIQQAAEEKRLEHEQAGQERETEHAVKENKKEQLSQKRDAQLAAQKKRIEMAIQKKKMEKTLLEREV